MPNLAQECAFRCRHPQKSVPNLAQPCVYCIQTTGRPGASPGGKGRKYTQNQGQGQPGARLREQKTVGFLVFLPKWPSSRASAPGRPWAEKEGNTHKTSAQGPGARGQARDGQGRPWASLGRKGRKYTQNQKMYSSAKLYTREVPCV